MSWAEEQIKKRLRNVMKDQAEYIMQDSQLTKEQKLEQMIVIEQIMGTLNKKPMKKRLKANEYSQAVNNANNMMQKIETQKTYGDEVR